MFSFFNHVMKSVLDANSEPGLPVPKKLPSLQKVQGVPKPMKFSSDI